MGIIRLWAFIVLFAISSCAAGRIRSSYQIYPVRAPSAATSFAKLGDSNAQIVMDSYGSDGDAPIRLTASDGTGLELQSLRARAIIDGPLAFTELTMRFHNPRKRELEGRFEITLPDSAKVARLAMKLGPKWQEAEVVARRRAQEVYESYLHKQVDPVLLEASVGNRFRARVYPIPARGDKEIIISYSEELPASGDYELFLAGMPVLDKVEVDVHRGERRERFIKRDFASPENLVVPGDAATASAHRAGELVMMHWVPEQRPVADVPRRLSVLVDSSASSAGIYGLQVRSLEALAAALAERYGKTVELDVASYDNQVHPVYSGPASGYGAAQTETLLAHGAMGASNLEAALGWARGKGDRLLLLGDGIATTGKRAPQALAAMLASKGPGRIDALSFASARDGALLGRLTQNTSKRGGVILSPSQSPGQWAEELGLAAPQDVKLQVAGASWIWPETVRPARAGGAVIAFAKFEVHGAARLDEIRLERTEASETSELRIPVVEGEAALIERQWAATQLANLEERQREKFSESRLAKIEEISHRFRVLTSDTAFLMLETEQDYQRFGIDRQDSSEVLTVDATGLRRVQRRGGAGRDIGWQELIRQPYSAGEGKDDSIGRGGMAGKVRDKASGEILAGVTVVITDSTRKNNYNAITDEAGEFALRDLPAGSYTILLIYGSAKARYDDIRITDDKSAQISAKIDLAALGGEVQVIKGRALIDTARTTQGITIDRAYTENLPIPGRTFESALSSAAGAQDDGVGITFSGSSSLENQYVVDGVNTTGLAFGKARAASSKSSPDKNVAKESTEVREFRRIRALLAKGAIARALHLSLRWSARSPTNLLALTALGEALFASGHYKLAARAFASIVDVYPTRADMHRVAAAYLGRLGIAGRSLRLDALRVAMEARPDHVHGIRLLAMEMAIAAQEREAIVMLLHALETGEDRHGRLTHIRDLLRHDVGIIAGAWLAREPSAVKRIKALLDDSGIMVPMTAQNYAVLSWESDVARLDLQAERAGGGEIKARTLDVGDIGYGPEAVLLDELDVAGLRFSVDFADQAMMGYAFAQLQLISLDEGGRLRVDSRAFVALEEHERVAMGGF